MIHFIDMEGLSWTALEFEQQDRHPDWLWYAGLAFAIAAALAFFYGNIFFGIFLVIAGVAVIFFAQRNPSTLAITIGEEEISINDERIKWDRVRQFWIDETGKPDKLLLLVKNSFIPTLALPLEGVSIEQVKEAIAPFAKESELRESRSIALFDRLGF